MNGSRPAQMEVAMDTSKLSNPTPLNFVMPCRKRGNRTKVQKKRKIQKLEKVSD